MTTISRYADYPPSTPMLRRSQRQPGGGIADQTPSDRADATISDSPLPPAPVSHFLGEDGSEFNAIERMPISIPAQSRAKPNRYPVAGRATSPSADDDSPGMGRRAAPIATHLEDLDIPRASSLFKDPKPRTSASRSSPFAAVPAYAHDELRSKSSPPFRPTMVTRNNRATVSPIRIDDPLPEAPLLARRRSNERDAEEEEKKVRYAPALEERASIKRDTPDDYDPRPPSSSAAAATAAGSGTTGYRTPAMAGRALRSSAATATAQRSAARSLRKLTRSSNAHPPARRVMRRYSDDEEDDLDDEMKEENQRNQERQDRQTTPEGDGHNIHDGSSGSGSASGSGSGGSAGAARPDPRFLPYGYDAQKEKLRAEMMERASLVLSPSPKARYEEQQVIEPQPELMAPPPRRNEAHPNARREAEPAQDNMLHRRRPNAGAIQGFLASSVAAPADPLAQRKNVAASSADLLRNPLAASRAANTSEPPRSLPTPAAPVSAPQTEEEMQDEAAKMFSDCRPEGIWAETTRQMEQPLAKHDAFMKDAQGSTKVVKMPGFKFRKVKKRGGGGFASVFVLRGPTCERVRSAENPGLVEEITVPDEEQAFFALKQVDLKQVESEQDKMDLIAEANTQRTLSDLEGSEAYLLRYFGHHVSGDKQGNPDKLRILMELGDRDFSRILMEQAPLSREAIVHYFREMLEAVQFIHEHNIVHADLKPANFLDVNNRLKLIDFGISKSIPKGTVHISRDAIIGTPNYMAPEAIKIAKAKGRRVYKAGKPSDVWSLGCILYQMIWGRPPFDRLSADRRLEGIMDPNHEIIYNAFRDPRYPDVQEVDEDMLDCVRSALRYHVEDRATIPELLNHPFLRREGDEQEEQEHDQPDESQNLEESVTITRATLRNLVGRLRVLALQQELTEDNVIERADLLFNNLKQAQQPQ